MTRKNFNELADRVMSDPERAARVREYDRAIDAALALGEMRKDRELTQTDVAAVLGVTQENVSRIEREDDLYISTLRGYVEALGGRLELRAVFPERAVELELSERELAGR